MSHLGNKSSSPNHEKQSGEATDRMGVAFFFCFISIVMVIGLYLCFWSKVEKAKQRNMNRHSIKMLEREVARLSCKVLWLEGSMAVADCDHRDTTTPPPSYSLVDEARETDRQVSYHQSLLNYL
eukprot:TRINITY_DN13970_c0_g1_i2.p1 TRINITY_DN13970_c0_g1~~TRINITY_DN13970_c0_g1_i2.p1  ORF type:complete len:141 (-),score=48.48 TRINITY_DN13970_c0_g1_i2:220-591(-)